MFKISKYFLLLLVAHALVAADPVRDFWFNGAEINRYELSQARYGANHPGHVEFVFVTEPFLIDQQVKDESGTGHSTDVLKLNALRTFNTGIYTLRYPAHDRTLTIRFDTAFPHIIRSWTDTSPRGTTTAVLKDRIMNSTYWSENQPEDRAKRRQLGLEPVAD